MINFNKILVKQTQKPTKSTFNNTSASFSSLIRIKTHFWWPDVNELINTMVPNNKEKFLVGGKLYRTIIEQFHGISVGAKDCDYDFFVEGNIYETLTSQLRAKWKYKKNPKLVSGGYPIPALRVEHRTYGFGVDIMGQSIGVKGGGPNLQGYFNQVPIDIQAIGISPIIREVFSNNCADKAIENLLIKPNPTVDLEGCWYNFRSRRDWIDYFKDKATSLCCEYKMPDNWENTPTSSPIKVKEKHKCCCNMVTIMSKGCQCGGV